MAALVPALDLRPVEPEILHAPANIEAEQALLGAILFDNAAYERLGDNLQARHFYEPFHARLYAAMEDHIRKGQLAEPIVLMERFKPSPEEATPTKTCPECKSSIPHDASRCAFCTVEQPAAAS